MKMEHLWAVNYTRNGERSFEHLWILARTLEASVHKARKFLRRKYKSAMNPSD